MLNSTQLDAFRRLRESQVWILTLFTLTAVSTSTANDRFDYLTRVKPVLRERCYACHGALKQEAGLRLDTVEFAVRGGDSGQAIEPGNADESLLLQRVTAAGEFERMPPEGELLTGEQIAAIREWIENDAVAPAEEQPDRDPRDHWAFQTPVRPSVPQIDQATPEWRRNSIDAFLSAVHQRHGLVPQPEADRRVWLRRVSLDLTGLPPTVEQLDAFVADRTDQAHQTVIDRLLDSPQYGERWGRHWMDIWRYSDWWGLGAEVRNSQKHMWHWRDWLVESLNADKGYDQMLREMLAADELYPNDMDRLRATGFLARQYFIFNRTTWLDETIEHSAKAMLGLTFNCAKCHDHKYDPLTQVEYYQFRALFEPYQIRHDMVPGETDFEKNGIPRVFDAHLDVPTYLHLRGDDRKPDESRKMEPAVPAFLCAPDRAFVINSIDLPAESTYPGLRDFVVQTHRDAAEQQLAAARRAIEPAQKALAAAETAHEPSNAAESAAKGESKSTVLLRDDFSTANPDLWKPGLGTWDYRDGRLVQSQTGSIRGAIRLTQLPPADFEARLKYVPTGGDQWKSVGISFDVTDGGNDILAYVSSVNGGSKSQIAWMKGGSYFYPPNANQPRQVPLGESHEIVLRVRGRLLNLEVDGEHSIALRLPSDQKRQQGFIELVAFDAVVEFTAFELRTLPNTLKLADAPSPGEKPSQLSVAEARLVLSIAEKAVRTAELQLESVESRAIAFAARHRMADADDESVEELAANAGKSEKTLAVAKADEALARAQLAVIQAAPEKKAEANKNLAAAKTAVEVAGKALQMPGQEFIPLPGARKTQEDYQNRNANAPFPESSTGRRSALARWITDPSHPLPARVAVNHIWMRHMGQPLVPTIFDFGRKGAPSTHPKLLDWLAMELIENEWSMKHLHRLIVTSQAYRMTSSSADASAGNRTVDPDNHFYWRMNSVRMESQVVRDSLLHIAGELDLTQGGPSIPISDEKSRRRSLYFVHSHNDSHKFLGMFDDANVLDCYRRAESIVPQQALALENSSLASEMATKIAARIEAFVSESTDAEFIRAAFLTVLSTEPTEPERLFVAQMLPQLIEGAREQKRPNPEVAARIAVILALLNHNDFVTIR